MQSILAELGAKYLWWERGRIAEVAPRRIIAQIMDIGEYADVQRAIAAVGEGAFEDALSHALPGWFRPRSWSYWHLRLGLRGPGEPNPPMPARTYS